MKFKVNKKPKINVYEWHKKFIWLPTKVNDTETDYEIAFGETIMQKCGHDARKKYTRYTQKEYFKRKLNGEDDVAVDKPNPWKGETGEKRDGNVKMVHDGTNFVVKTTDTGDWEVTKPAISVTNDADTGFHTPKSYTVTRDKDGRIKKVET